MLQRIPKLMYHSVYDGHDHPVGVSVKQLDENMSYLSKRGFIGKSFRDHLRAPSPYDVCLSFDDGYINNLELAAPVLEKYGWSATFFVCVNLAGDVMPWHENDPQYLMGPNEWKELADAGHEIASHGLTHRRITELGTADKHRELVESRDRLSDVVGEVTGYAYPSGCFDSEVRALVQDNYDYACATRYRRPLIEDQWIVRRIGINRFDQGRRFRMKLSKTFRLCCDIGF